MHLARRRAAGWPRRRRSRPRLRSLSPLGIDVQRPDFRLHDGPGDHRVPLRSWTAVEADSCTLAGDREHGSESAPRNKLNVLRARCGPEHQTQGGSRRRQSPSLAVAKLSCPKSCRFKWISISKRQDYIRLTDQMDIADSTLHVHIPQARAENKIKLANVTQVARKRRRRAASPALLRRRAALAALASRRSGGLARVKRYALSISSLASTCGAPLW